MNQLQEGLEYLLASDLEAALTSFVAYTEENPEDPVGYINVGNMLMQGHHYEKAENFFLKAIEKDEHAATAYYGLGNLHYTAEIFENAELMFNKALALGLEDSDVFFMIGMTHVKRNNHKLSLPFLQRASELQPTDAQKVFQYGLAFAKTSYLKEAERVFNDVLKLEGCRSDALYNLALIEVEKDHPETALDLLRQVLENEPEHQLAKQATVKLKETGSTP